MCRRPQGPVGNGHRSIEKRAQRTRPQTQRGKRGPQIANLQGETKSSPPSSGRLAGWSKWSNNSRSKKMKESKKSSGQTPPNKVHAVSKHSEAEGANPSRCPTRVEPARWGTRRKNSGGRPAAPSAPGQNGSKGQHIATLEADTQGVEHCPVPNATDDDLEELGRGNSPSGPRLTSEPRTNMVSEELAQSAPTIPPKRNTDN